MTDTSNVVDFAEYRETDNLSKLVQATGERIKTLMASGDPDDLLQASKLLKEQAANQKRLKVAEKKEQLDAALEDVDAAALRESIKADIREWLKDNDYYYVHKTACFWLYNPRLNTWFDVDKFAMQYDNPQFADRDYMDLFIETLREDGRWFYEQTYSFGDTGRDTLNMLRPDFCPMAPEGSEQPHWLFNILMHSLGGGVAENIQHIEKLVLAKYLHPENYTLPALAIYDTDGGSGKSVFVAKLIKTIFGEKLVADNISMSDLTGKFNEHVVAKAIWFVNESVEDKIDENKLKQTLHSPTFYIEPKGRKKFEVDNTAWLIVAGNGEGGCIKLANADTDRRFSVVKPTKPMKEWLAPRLSEKEGREYSPNEAYQWVFDYGQAILSDPVQVGLWLRSLMDTHGPQHHVMALHGKDYKDLVEVQTPLHDQLFDAVFLNADFSYIKRPTLYDLYFEIAKRHNVKPFGNRKLFAKVETWAKRKGLTVHCDKVNWKIGLMRTKADAYSLIPLPGTVDCNDRDYIGKDDYGHRVIKVEVQ